MNKTERIFLKALETAWQMSESCLRALQKNDFNAALNILDNRDRAVNIVLHLEANLEMTPSISDQASQLLAKINERDAEIHQWLSAEKLATQNEIAKTRKNKENFRGYNLNNLK